MILQINVNSNDFGSCDDGSSWCCVDKIVVSKFAVVNGRFIGRSGQVRQSIRIAFFDIVYRDYIRNQSRNRLGWAQGRRWHQIRAKCVCNVMILSYWFTCWSEGNRLFQTENVHMFIGANDACRPVWPPLCGLMRIRLKLSFVLMDVVGWWNRGNRVRLVSWP